MSLPQPYPLFDKLIFGESTSRLISISLAVFALSIMLIIITFFLKDRFCYSHSFLAKANRILLFVSTKIVWISLIALICFIVVAVSPFTKQADKTIPQVYQARVIKPKTPLSPNFGLRKTATDKLETIRLQLATNTNAPDKKWASLKKPSLTKFLGVDQQPLVDLHVITIGKDGITVVDADRNTHPYLVRSLLQDDFKEGHYYTISRKVLGEQLYQELHSVMKENNPYQIDE